jgi:hypothetical protein
MNNLSHGAQAVLDATKIQLMSECNMPWIAASALRAAVYNVYSCDMRDDILAIAAELEALP